MSAAPPSPISTLPVEILIQIFELATGGDDEGEGHRCRRALTHVSRFWRGVALDAPALWATFAPGFWDRKENIACCRRELGFAKLADLRVVFKWRNWMGQGPASVRKGLSMADQHEVLRLAFAEQARWKSLLLSTFSFPDEIKRALVLGLQSVALPKLRSFELLQAGLWDDVPSEIISLVCHAAPSLGCLHLKHVVVTEFFPLPSLRELRMHECEVHADLLLDLLSSSEQLEVLQLCCFAPLGSYPAPQVDMSGGPRYLVLPRLHTLSMTIRHEEHQSWFVDHLISPSLQHAQIIRLCTDSGPFDRLVRALIGKGWPLETLDIETVPMTQEAFDALLRSLLTLRRLRVQIPVRTDVGRFISLFTEHDDDDGAFRACPHLRELYIKHPCEPRVISEIVEARHPDPTARLCRITADLVEVMSRHKRTRLEKMVDFRQSGERRHPEVEWSPGWAWLTDTDRC